MLNIAVLEDNDDLRSAMVGALRREGHNAVGLESAESFVETGGPVALDLLIVDLNLPGEDGVSFTRRIRSVQPEVGIIMVTARGRTADKTLGYEAGADLYLTKPLPLAELNAAISALERRLKPRPAMGELVLHSADYSLRGPGGSVQLSATEATLVAAFARAPDRRLETWQILEILDRPDEEARRATLTVAIFRLGQKLRQAGGGERLIRAIRNWGYQLQEPVRLV